MRLDNLQAELRQRNPWEAIDLGFAMARRWWRPLMAAWIAAVLPLGILIAVGLHRLPILAVLLLWWLKPLWGRVPRFVLSRALFGATPGVREVLGAKLWRKNPGDLLWRRPDPLRAFLSPIADLEDLSGSARRKRRAVLGQRGSGAAMALTLIGMLMEVAVMIGLAGLVMMMMPDAPQYSAEVLMDRILTGSPPAWLSAVMPGVYLAAVSLVEPLVVAGGFGLYINRRTRLEGWDVELVQQRWKYRHEWPPAWLEFSPTTQKIVPYLGELLRVLAYGFLTIVLVVAVGMVLRHVRLPARRHDAEPPPLSLRDGLMPDPEAPLPADLAEQAWILWCAGRLPEALSLLYRGALADLIATGLRIEEGATEGDCLRSARRARESDQIDAAALAYFAGLTRHWTRLAYARRPPTPDQAEALCTTWGQHFTVRP